MLVKKIRKILLCYMPDTIVLKRLSIVLATWFIFTVLMTAIISCKNRNPQKVYFYDIYANPVQKLNGSVKVLSAGDSSLLKGGFYQITFDEKGDQIKSEFRNLDVVETDGVADTSVEVIKVNYTSNYDKNGVKISMLGHGIENETGANLSVVSMYAGEWTMKWTFNKQGLVSNYQPNLPASTIAKYTFKYDNAGNLIENICTQRNEITRDVYKDWQKVYKYRYNDNGLLMESEKYEEKKLLTKTNYQYLVFDSFNNYTSLKVIRTYPGLDRPREIDTVTRKITYY